MQHFFHELIGSFKRNEWFGGEVENTNWPDKFGLPNPFQTTRWPQIGNLNMGNYGYITNDTKKNHDPKKFDGDWAEGSAFPVEKAVALALEK